MKTKIFAVTSLLMIVPSFSYAATLGFGSLVELADTLATGVVTSLGYLMFALAVVAFLSGMVKFIWAARNGDAGKGVENGKQFMLWGLIALFVMFSVWGIIIFVQGVFNIKGNTSIVIPNIELLGSSPSSANPTTDALPVANSAATDALSGANSQATDALPSGNQPAGVANGCYDTATSKILSGAGCIKNDSAGNQGNGKCDNSGKCILKDQTCTTIVCTNPNNKSTCTSGDIGKYNSIDVCVADVANITTNNSATSATVNGTPNTGCSNGVCPTQTTDTLCSTLGTPALQTTCFQGKVCNLIASESERALCLKLKATIPYAQYSSKTCGLIVSESDRETCKIVQQANK